MMTQLNFLDFLQPEGKPEVFSKVLGRILATGSNRKNSTKLINMLYAYNFSKEKRILFLKKIYGEGGFGFNIDGKDIAEFFDDEGIKLAYGKSAKNNYDELYTWESVEEKINDMFTAGTYPVVYDLSAYVQNILQYMAAVFYKEVFCALPPCFSGNFLSWDYFSGRFSDMDYAKLILSDIHQRNSDADAGIIKAKRCAWSRHDFEYMLNRFCNGYSPVTSSSEEIPLEVGFITEDEIIGALLRWDIERKYRIYTNLNDTKKSRADKINCLKQMYGIGGSSILGYEGISGDYDGKGLKLTKNSFKDNEISITLSWDKVYSKYMELKEDNQLITENEILQAEEKLEIQKKIKSLRAGEHVIVSNGEEFEIISNYLGCIIVNPLVITENSMFFDVNGQTRVSETMLERYNFTIKKEVA